MKRVMSFMLVLCMLFTMIPSSLSNVYAATSINDSSVFIKQSKSGRCTIASAVMLMRRKAILDGNQYWDSITENSAYSAAWSGGLNWTFTFAGMTLDTSTIEGSVADKKAKIISMLESHPEGVVIYSYGNGLKTHAVLALDYDAAADIIYCADPAGGMPYGRIPLTSVYMSGTTQDERIGNIKQYWVLIGGSCNLTSPAQSTVPVPAPITHVHSYESGYNPNHPHKKYEKCDSCGDKFYTGKFATLSDCQQCYPIGYMDLERYFDDVKGTATFKWNNVKNAHHYNFELRKDGKIYDEFTITSTKYNVSGLEPGKYTATLTAVNELTCQKEPAVFGSFTILQKYNVSYNANGGKGAPSPGTKVYGKDFDISSVIPTKTGYVFKGWASSKYATKPQYQAGGKYKINADMVLHAIWEPEVYTINFDVNGGMGEIKGTTVTYGNTIKMPNNVIRENYYLRGWAKSASATEPDFALGLDHKLTQSMTLYAVWGSSTWSGDVSDSLTGEGTQENPYQISDAADLAYLAKCVNSQTSAPEYKHYVLTDNINLGYVEWVPIGVYGSSNQYFHGSIDGNGYTVSNLYITKANEGYIGLFGYVSDSEIKNFNISADIAGITSDSAINVGSFAGYAANTVFDKCSSMYVNIASISGSSSAYSRVGGIVGYLNGGSINGCNSIDCHIDLKSGDFESGLIAGYSDAPVSECTVSATENGLFSTAATAADMRVGGICGTLNNNAEKCIVEAPYFSNTIKTTASSNVGGLVGYLGGSVSVCSVKFTDGALKTIDGEDFSSSIYVSGTGSGNIGGIAGYTASDSKISDCKYDGQSVSGVTTSGDASVGGLVGSAKAKTNANVTSRGVSTLNRELLPKREGFHAVWYKDADLTTEYDFSTTLSENQTIYAEWVDGSENIDIWDGTAKEPSYDSSTKTYTITNGEELYWISGVSSGDIVSGMNFPSNTSFSGYKISLTNDIYLNDVSDYKNWSSSAPDNTWKKISSFSGTFNGNNYRIFGLYISTGVNPSNINPNSAGLFDVITSSGRVENLILSNGWIKSEEVGAIASSNEGIITNCHNESCNIQGYNSCGGIVAFNQNTVSKCTNSANVLLWGGSSQSWHRAGGIAGHSEEDVLQCYNYGSVVSEVSEYGGRRVMVGGIVGSSSKISIKDCCNSADVETVSGSAGGILGGNIGKGGSVSIKYCQNLGSVSGTIVGGIAGSITAVYSADDNYASNYVQWCYNRGAVSGDTSAGLVGCVYNRVENAILYIRYCYSYQSNKYNLSSTFDGTLKYSDPDTSSMSGTTAFETDSSISSRPYLKAIKNYYITRTVTVVEDVKDAFSITRTFADIDGIVYGNANKNANVGSAIGYSTGTTSSASKASKIMTSASKVSSISSGSSYFANVGSLIGKNNGGYYSFDGTVYYNPEMATSKINSAASANVAEDTTGNAKAKKTINSAFLTNILGLSEYTSIANLENDSTAVWVMTDGDYPELYYNCLNDITISEDIENGNVMVDKAQEVDGKIVTLTAIPDEGYVLNKIYINGEEIAGNTFTVAGDAEIYATFAEKIPVYTVEIAANENASGTLTNIDNTDAVSLMSTGLSANDGEEIQITASPDEDYAVEAIYVNGKEIVGDRFIVNDNTTVTMDIINISTDITAVTNDPELIGIDMAVLGGSVSDGREEAAKYIRYWRMDTPDEVYTSEVEKGIGDYRAMVGPLEENTAYCYQMTELGEVKTFTTLQSDYVEEEVSEPAITTTTYKALTSTYKFTVESAYALETEVLAVAAYDSYDNLLSVDFIECDGDTTYTSSFSNSLSISYVKVFVWGDKQSLIPLGRSEIVDIQ